MSVSLREENKMAVRPVFPLLMSMAIPPMISMLIQSLYNIVDSMFVAKIGEDALTAVSLAFPVQTLIVACSVGIGVGVNSYISRSLGREDQQGADSAVAHGLLMAAFVSVLFVLAGQFLLEPFFRMFSSDPLILSEAIAYTQICLTFCAGCFIHICIEKVFQSTGSMIFPMLLQALGAITNIILDPIMIFGLFGFPAMGVKGAAVATVIGQHTAMLASLLVFLLGKFAVRLDLRNFRFSWKMIRDIATIAVPNSCMNALGSVLVMGLNSILIGFSNTAVSLFGIYYKLQTFLYLPANGIVQGMRPLIGYNYGARRPDRVKKTIKCAMFYAEAIMLVGFLLFQFLPDKLLGLFSASEAMLAIGKPALRIICFHFLLAGMSIILSSTFQALGNGMFSLIISVCRQLVVLLPAAWLLSKTGNVNMVWWSFVIAELASVTLSFIFFARLDKKIIEPMYDNAAAVQ